VVRTARAKVFVDELLNSIYPFNQSCVCSFDQIEAMFKFSEQKKRNFLFKQLFFKTLLRYRYGVQSYGAWTNFSLQDEPLGRVFNFRSGCCMHTMHLLPGVAIKPNLELKTRPKQLLGSLPLVIALPIWSVCCKHCHHAQ
jgi:hypothetical protein